MSRPFDFRIEAAVDGDSVDDQIVALEVVLDPSRGIPKRYVPDPHIATFDKTD